MNKKELIIARTKQESKLTGMLQLAKRAGKLEIGTDCVLRAINRLDAKLIIVASDISENTLKKIINNLTNKKTKIISFSNKHNISISFGTRDIGVFAITDKNFADGILKIVS